MKTWFAKQRVIVEIVRSDGDPVRMADEAAAALSLFNGHEVRPELIKPCSKPGLWYVNVSHELMRCIRRGRVERATGGWVLRASNSGIGPEVSER